MLPSDYDMIGVLYEYRAKCPLSEWSPYLLFDCSAGGPWLITDMRRGETIFELDPSFQEKLEQGNVELQMSWEITCAGFSLIWVCWQDNNDVDIL